MKSVEIWSLHDLYPFIKDSWEVIKCGYAMMIVALFSHRSLIFVLFCNMLPERPFDL